MFFKGRFLWVGLVRLEVLGKELGLWFKRESCCFESF